MSDSHTTFSINLQNYMDANNLSRHDLCKALDIPYTTVSSWLSCASYPRIDKIEALAEYFNITKKELTEDSSSLKNELLEKINSLPPSQHKLVLDMIDTLLANRHTD